LNLINLQAGGIRDWKNNDKVSFNNQNLDDHHVFPKKYLQQKYPQLDDIRVDCVLNRALVPKITNIKMGGNPPSRYLKELLLGNPDLGKSLESHLIPPDLIDGVYDDSYELFLKNRAKKVIDVVNTQILPLKAELERDMFGTDV